MTRPSTATADPLETRGYGAKTFFIQDAQPAVLAACRRSGIRFEDFAARLGITRVALVLILKGQDPVPTHMLGAIRRFIDEAPAAANQDEATRSTAA